MSDEIFISMDIEADGRVPGLSSMLSMGAAAFTLDKVMHGWFSVNLTLLEGAAPEPAVTEFWDRNPRAYDATRQNVVSPANGIPMFRAWLKAIAGDRQPVFVGYPAAFDYKWVDYYCVRFSGANPFGHSRCIDIKSFAWAHIGGKFIHVSKRNSPKKWFDPAKHTHIAHEDAIEQGRLFVNMVRDVRGLPKVEFEG